MKNLLNTNKNFFKIILGVTLFCFVIMTYGCYTADIQDVPEEKIPKLKGTYLIQSITTKKGELISFTEDNQPKFYSVYKDTTNVFVYTETKSINTTADKQKVVMVSRILPIKEILSIKIERSELNVGLTVLVGVGVAAVIIGILYILSIMLTKDVIDDAFTK